MEDVRHHQDKPRTSARAPRRAGSRWLAFAFACLAAAALTACGVPNAGVTDFSGTWVGEGYDHDLCIPDCGTVSGPHPVTLVIVQSGSDIEVDFDDGYCLYEGQAFFGSFAAEEPVRETGGYRCGDDDPLPVVAELAGGVLSGRAYFEARGDTYCMVDEYGCYTEFEVERED